MVEQIVIFLKKHTLFFASNASRTQQLISKATFDMINYIYGCRVDFSFAVFFSSFVAVFPALLESMY
jgi:hypothetical protein